jgi:hypothetical protein
MQTTVRKLEFVADELVSHQLPPTATANQHTTTTANLQVLTSQGTITIVHVIVRF